jgi:hypothetical protein
MKLFLMLLGVIMAQVSLIIAFHTSHLIVSILLLFLSVTMIFGGLPNMSDYNWCHGPNCHTNKTQDRIRGVKGSKVLRTRKIAENQWNQNSVWSTFCSQGCYTDFFYKHWQEVIAIAPKVRGS